MKSNEREIGPKLDGILGMVIEWSRATIHVMFLSVQDFREAGLTRVGIMSNYLLLDKI